MSSRFSLLQSIKLATFFPDGQMTGTDLTETTIGDLVEMSPHKISSAAKEQLGAVVDVIEKLVATSDPAPAENPSQRLSSVEAEEILARALTTLTRSSVFSKIRDVIVEDFWPATGPKAPFICCMTFGQLGGMKVRNLLDKRSFGDGHVLAIEQAVKAVLETNTAIKTPAPNKNPKSLLTLKPKKFAAASQPGEQFEIYVALEDLYRRTVAYPADDDMYGKVKALVVENFSRAACRALLAASSQETRVNFDQEPAHLLRRKLKESLPAFDSMLFALKISGSPVSGLALGELFGTSALGSAERHFLAGILLAAYGFYWDVADRTWR